MGGVNGARDIAAITGMAAEARLLRRYGIRADCSGGHPERAEAVARDAVAAGARGLLSFGVAGGLDPALVPGQVVVARRVIAGGGGYDADVAWTRWALATLPWATSGLVAGAAHMVMTAAAKQELRAHTGAEVVDMESHRAAAVAAGAGVPLLIVRAVADPADQGLPGAAQVALRPDGTMAVGAAVCALARAPGEVGLALRSAVVTRQALQALARCAPILAAGAGR